MKHIFDNLRQNESDVQLCPFLVYAAIARPLLFSQCESVCVCQNNMWSSKHLLWPVLLQNESTLPGVYISVHLWQILSTL